MARLFKNQILKKRSTVLGLPPGSLVFTGEAKVHPVRLSVVDIKMLYFDQENRWLRAEQVSLVAGENYVLSFQEVPGDVFEPVRQRLHNANGRIRQHGADYLAYALLDVIMKVLTIIATIFIPLTFIVGIYGMNFDNMPELHLRYGYPVVMLVMLLLGVGLAVYFKWEKWF